VPDQTVRDVVRWTVQDPPPEARVVRRVGSLVDGLLVLATWGTETGGATPPSWLLPPDLDTYADLGVLRLRGDAPWLPRAGRRGLRVRATRRDAWVDGTRGPATRIPLEELSLTDAHPLSRSRRPKHPDAQWSLSAAGSSASIRLDGAWLGLAYVGLLAGWPEPAG